MAQDPDLAHTVAELREGARSLLDLLDARGEALLVLSTGVVVINANRRDLQRGGIDPNLVDDNFVRSVYAPSHEMVHMRQLLTTRFALEMSIEFSNLCALTNRHRRAQQPESQWLPGLLAQYRAAQDRLTVQKEGQFSNLQVLEAQAVLEGFRGGMSRHTEAGLALVRQLAHGDQAEYAPVIDQSLVAVGFDLTLEVLPKLCWLALDTPEPGVYLAQALASLTHADAQWMANVPAVNLVKALSFNPDDLAQSWRLKHPGIRNCAIHGILGRYFDLLETEPDTEAYLQMGMHPGRHAGSRLRPSDLMPPLAIFADDVFLPGGPYADMGWQAAEPLLRMTAMLVESLGWLDARARAVT